MVYQLTYELKTPDKDYSVLFEYLEHGLGEDVQSKHVLRDCWWFATPRGFNVDEMCDHIRQMMGDMDNLYLSKLPENDINGWLPSSIWKWYSENKG